MISLTPHTILAALLTFTVGASAQTPACQERDHLIEQAMDARRAQDTTTALELALQARACRVTSSLEGFIAGLYLSRGQHLEALRHAEECARTIADERPTPSREHYMRQCPEIVARARARLGVVRLATASSLPVGARVTIAGVVVDGASLGGEHLVTPGRVVVEVTAPGYEPFRREEVIAAGVTTEVPVALRAVRPPQQTSRVVPVVLMAAGAAAGVAAAALYARALVEASDSSDLCPDGGGSCDEPASRAAYSGAGTLRDVSVGLLVSGAVVAVAGVVWYLWPSARPASRPTLSFGAAPLPGGATVFLGGRL